VKTGVNFSTIYEEDPENLFNHEYYYVPGIHFGIMVDIEINHNNIFETGLKYSATGFKVDVVGVVDDKEAKYCVEANLEYLAIAMNYIRKFYINQSYGF